MPRSTGVVNPKTFDIGLPSVTIMVRLSLQATVVLTSVFYHVSATSLTGVPSIPNVPKAQGKKNNFDSHVVIGIGVFSFS